MGKKILINILTFLIVMGSSAGIVYMKKDRDYKKMMNNAGGAQTETIPPAAQDPGAELFFAAVSDVLERGVDLDLALSAGETDVAGRVLLSVDPLAVRAELAALGHEVTLDYDGASAYVAVNDMKFRADVAEFSDAFSLLTAALGVELGSGLDLDFSAVAEKIMSPDLVIPYTDNGDGTYVLALSLSSIGLDLSALGVPADFTAYLTVGGEKGAERFLSARTDELRMEGLPVLSLGAEFRAGEVVFPEIDGAAYADLTPVVGQIASAVREGLSARAELDVAGRAIDGTVAYDAKSGNVRLTAAYGEHALDLRYAGGRVYLRLNGLAFSLDPADALSFLEKSGIALPAFDAEDLDIPALLDKILRAGFEADGGKYTVALDLGGYAARLTLGAQGIESLSLAGEGLSARVFDLAAGGEVAAPAADAYYDAAPVLGQISDILNYGVAFDVSLRAGDFDVSGKGALRLTDGGLRARLDFELFGRKAALALEGSSAYLSLGEQGLKVRLTAEELVAFLERLGVTLPSAEGLDAEKLILTLLSSARMTGGGEDFELSLEAGGAYVAAALGAGGISGVTVATAGETALFAALENVRAGSEYSPVEIPAEDASAYLAGAGVLDQIADILTDGLRADVSLEAGGRLIEGTLSFDAANLALSLSASYRGNRLDVVYVGETVYLSAGDMKFRLGTAEIAALAENFGIVLPDFGSADVAALVRSLLDAKMTASGGNFVWTIGLSGMEIGVTMGESGIVALSVRGESFALTADGVTAGADVSAPAGDYCDVAPLLAQVADILRYGAETEFSAIVGDYKLGGTLAFRYLAEEKAFSLEAGIGYFARMQKDGAGNTVPAKVFEHRVLVKLQDGALYAAVDDGGLKIRLTLAEISELLGGVSGGAPSMGGADVEEVILQLLAASFAQTEGGYFLSGDLSFAGMNVRYFALLGEGGLKEIGAKGDAFSLTVGKIVAGKAEDGGVVIAPVADPSAYLSAGALLGQVTEILEGGLSARIAGRVAGNEVSGDVQLLLSGGFAARASLVAARGGASGALNICYSGERLYIDLPGQNLKLVAGKEDLSALAADLAEILAMFRMDFEAGGQSGSIDLDGVIEGILSGTQQPSEGGFDLALQLLGMDFSASLTENGISRLAIAKDKTFDIALENIGAGAENFDGSVPDAAAYTSLSAVTRLTGGVLETMGRKAFSITPGSSVTIGTTRIDVNAFKIVLDESAGSNFFETLANRLMDIEADIAVSAGEERYAVKLWYERPTARGNGKTLFVEFNGLKLRVADDSIFGIAATVCKLMGMEIPPFLEDFISDPSGSDIFNQGAMGKDEEGNLDIDLPAILGLLKKVGFENDGTAHVTLAGDSALLASLGLTDDLTLSVLMQEGANGTSSLAGIVGSGGAFALDVGLQPADTAVSVTPISDAQAAEFVDISPIKGLLDALVGSANKPDRAAASRTVRLETGETATTKEFYVSGTVGLDMIINLGLWKPAISAKITLYAQVLVTTVRDASGNFVRQAVEAYIRSENDKKVVAGFGVNGGYGEIFYSSEVKEEVDGEEQSVLYLSRTEGGKDRMRHRVALGYLSHTEGLIRELCTVLGLTDSTITEIIKGVTGSTYVTTWENLFAELNQTTDVNGNQKFYGYEEGADGASKHELAVSVQALTGEKMLQDLSILLNVAHDAETDSDYIGSLHGDFGIKLVGDFLTCDIDIDLAHELRGELPSDKTGSEAFDEWLSGSGRALYTELLK